VCVCVCVCHLTPYYLESFTIFTAAVERAPPMIGARPDMAYALQ